MDLTSPTRKVWASFPIAGKDVSFLEPTGDQYVVIRRLERALSRPDASPESVERAAILLLDALSYLMEDDEMRDHVDGAVLTGQLTLSEFMDALAAALAEKNTDQGDGSQGRPAKRAARAPAKRAAKATTRGQR